VESNLRARVRAGDADTFEALFEQYARKVYNHAFRLTGNWSSAEEVVSLTFLEAWRLRETVNTEGGSLQPWLLGIAANVARNVSRAARRHQAAMSRLPPPVAVQDFAEELAGRLDDAAQVAAARKAMRRLRQRERQVIELCVWSGLDYAAAAETLGVPVGTARSRLSRARKRLGKLVTPPRTRGPESRVGQADRNGQDIVRPREDNCDESQSLRQEWGRRTGQPATGPR
jgi:RNA polymerase sigma-70 factor (ECF subfamily)